ncbi:hypothetical protein BGW80DRAFT_1251674 [Lactifluus volemus]|nr:hypothetical protein BGW80DRAFT_1251674 [Lactifluus volemus]
MATLLISRAPSLLALLRMNKHPHARRTQHYLPRADIDVHGGIEHVVRRDTYHQSNEGIPDGPLVVSFLRCATGPPPKGPGGSTRPVSFPERLALFAVTAHVATATLI